MVDVSVGVASACIAAVIALLQFILPNALALVLTGHVSESHSAVTWSVISRFLLTSDWPLFLKSDHATSRSVSKKILFLTWIKPFTLFLIAVAAILTPLGLHDQIRASSTHQLVDFVYVGDSSIIGSGTPARSSRGYNLSRSCAFKYNSYPRLCPYDPYEGNVTRYELNYTSNRTQPYSYFVLPDKIAPTLIDRYQSGLSSASSSLSSFFDIQYRQWSIYTDTTIIGNGTLLTRAYKWLSTTLMDDKHQLFEGVIADTKSGGIGFRNHSIPATTSQYGFEWDEDILWMQPDTACVNSNLTSIFTGTISGYASLSGELVDRGGFANIAKEPPYPNVTDFYLDGQRQPMLYERAYWMAWYTNAQAMNFLNISEPGTNRSRISSTVGQRFVVNSSLTRMDSSSYNNLERGSYFATVVATAPSGYMWNSSTRRFDLQSNPNIPNPWNVTSDYFTDATLAFRGYGRNDLLNISTIAVNLGYILGPPLVTNRVDPDNATSVATYERALYVCSSATKVSIKKVRFRYNATEVKTLKNLEILDIKDKEYGKEGLPLWGFEVPWLNSTTTWNISEINPLWGIVDESNTSNPNMSTIRSDHFYIPAGATSVSGTLAGYSDPYGNYLDYVPGTTAPVDNWGQLYSMDNDYHDDNVQLSFFRDMTKNATTVERLANLMWTDYATNYMVGTRGVHTPRYKAMLSQSSVRKRDSDSGSLQDVNFKSLQDGQYPVYNIQRQLRYHWYWAIPALICIAIVGLAVFFAVVGMVFGSASVTRLRNMMYSISTGRVFASFVYPEMGDQKAADTKQWIDSVGHREIQPYGHSTALVQTPWRDSKIAPTYVRIAQQDEPMSR